MAHIELPVLPFGHITLVHIPRALTGEEAQAICFELQSLGQFIASDSLELYWLQEELFGRYGNVKVRLVEDAGRTLHKAREELVMTLETRGIPVSKDFSEWQPHVSKAQRGIPNWAVMDYRPELVLVQKPHRVTVPF